jgi:hypothetical protein
MAWLRLRQVALVAEHLAPVVDDLEAVFGLQVAYRDPGVEVFGLENAVLPVGEQFIDVVAPTRQGTTAGRYLERRNGPGGYMVITHTDDHDARRRRVEELGVRTVFGFEDHGYHCMQLHPGDTGGSFLEIDRQEGGDEAFGPWHPAGPDWPSAARTEIVDGIRAVEIQAADPGVVAARWSEIVEIPLRDGAVLPLDNAEVRFVDAIDDRGDGLAAVELSVVDADAATAAARRRGLLDHQATISICGTRFVLASG